MSVSEGVVESVHFEFAGLIVVVSSKLLWCPLQVGVVIQSAGFACRLCLSHTIEKSVHLWFCWH